MGKDSLQIALIKYNKKTWCKSALLGFFVGLAIIVPGISGSTVAIIFKLYDSFLYALGNLLKKFKECFLFLLPIGIGAVIGVLLGFIAVDKLLELLPFAVVCLFAGLMTGAFPAVADEIKEAKTTKKRIALFALGLAIPLALGIYSAISVSSAGGLSVDVFASVQWWHVLISVLLGAMVGLTQIVPGLSASALLMAVGWFTGLVASVSMTYWKINPQIFLVYGGLAIGFVLGILLFSKLLTSIFEKARHSAYFMIVGLSLGSILSMFCNGDVMKVYLSWKVDVNLLDVILGVGLFAIGVVGAYLLVRYQRKKDTEKGENK